MLQRDDPYLEALAQRQHHRPVGQPAGAMALHELPPSQPSKVCRERKNPANSKASSSSRNRRGHDSHHLETRSPSLSRLRSPLPYSDNDRGRSSLPSNRSSASGMSNLDNYATFAEAIKPPARERSGRKASKAEPPCKHNPEPSCKGNRLKMKSVDDCIPRKQTTILESSSSEEDGETHTVDVCDENNPLDM